MCRNKKKYVKLVETVNNIHCINSIENLKVNESLIIDLVVNDQLMTFEVDSEASVTVRVANRPDFCGTFTILRFFFPRPDQNLCGTYFSRDIRKLC